MVSDRPLSQLFSKSSRVLILVLMEYGLWHAASSSVMVGLNRVLILVLMEYGLWPGIIMTSNPGTASLNPCSNGIWSLTKMFLDLSVSSWRLNPCSNGIWSLTKTYLAECFGKAVLILVLMEYGLWRRRSEFIAAARSGLNPCSNGIWSLTKMFLDLSVSSWRLNPCSNGIWSLTL